MQNKLIQAFVMTALLAGGVVISSSYCNSSPRSARVAPSDSTQPTDTTTTQPASAATQQTSASAQSSVLASTSLRSGVFGGGPFYSKADTVLPAVRAAGFQTLILWTLHVNTNGDLVYNDIPIIQNGSYVGDPAWPAKIAAVKTAPSSVDRLEWCIGSAGVADFEHVQTLVAAGGTNQGGILQRNFAALRNTFPNVDAISYDDESNYDVASSLNLSLMLGKLGLHVSLTPYTMYSFWQELYQQANAESPGLVDRVYLQAYAGGTGNQPASWNNYFPGIKVDLGLWGKHGSNCSQGSDPQAVSEAIAAQKSNISGGWLWLLDDLLACQRQYPLADYVNAIHQSVEAD